MKPPRPQTLPRRNPGSPIAQLSLLERLGYRPRLVVSGRRDTWEADLAAMAADPEIQRELNRSHAEFRVTETYFVNRKPVQGREQHYAGLPFARTASVCWRRKAS